MEREQDESYPDAFGPALKFTLEKGLAKEAEEKKMLNKPISNSYESFELINRK